MDLLDIQLNDLGIVPDHQAAANQGSAGVRKSKFVTTIQQRYKQPLAAANQPVTATTPMAAPASDMAAVPGGGENSNDIFNGKRLSFLEKKLVERSRFRSLERALKTVNNRH